MIFLFVIYVQLQIYYILPWITILPWLPPLAPPPIPRPALPPKWSPLPPFLLARCLNRRSEIIPNILSFIDRTNLEWIWWDKAKKTHTHSHPHTYTHSQTIMTHSIGLLYYNYISRARELRGRQRQGREIPEIKKLPFWGLPKNGKWEQHS